MENGGDSTGGAETAALVGVLNAIVFLPLWSVGALLGFKPRRGWNEHPRASASSR